MNYDFNLSIIIPTKNEEKYLPLLLNSIHRQNIFGKMEIIVADANSTDNTLRIAQERGCRIVSGGYPSEGRTSGGRNAIYENLCFLDSDSILSDDYFLFYAGKEIRERNLDIAGTFQKPIRTGNFLKDAEYSAFYECANLAMQFFENSKTPKMQNCMFMSKQLFDELGGFRECFSDDSDMAQRAVSLSNARFGMLYSVGKVLISPRRLENKGFFRMLGKYILYNSIAQLKGHTAVSSKRYFEN